MIESITIYVHNELTWVFGNDHRSLGDVGEAVQPDLGEVGVIVDHERQAREVGGVDAANQHQVGEQLAKAGQPGHPVHDQVLRDLAQHRETDIEVGRLGGVQQHDVHVPVDDGAVVQGVEPVAGAAHHHAVANLFLAAAAAGRREQRRPEQQQQQRGRRDRGPPTGGGAAAVPAVHGRENFLSKRVLYFIVSVHTFSYKRKNEGLGIHAGICWRSRVSSSSSSDRSEPKSGNTESERATSPSLTSTLQLPARPNHTRHMQR